MDKKYFTIVMIDGEQCPSVKTEKELAEYWETNDLCGCYDEIVAFTYNADTQTMERVNVYDVAQNYLNQRNAIQQEYEDYCEAVNEYGLNFESMT